MQKRINVSLSEETVRLLDRVAGKGDRSNLIEAAVRRYITQVGRANLRKRMKEEALTRGDSDLEVAAEFFNVDTEAWGQRASD